jgi:TonB family protein
MKRCKACDEEFEDKFSFCPVDATPLNSLAAVVVGGDADDYTQIDSRAHRKDTQLTGIVPLAEREFRVTMIDTTALPERLARELRFMIQELRRGWPAAKRDPIGFGRRVLVTSRLRIGSALAAPNSLAGIVTALAIVFTAAMILLLSGGFSNEDGVARGADANPDNEQLAQIVEFTPEPRFNPKDRGVGVGSHGRVGLANGKGEGSAPQLRKSTGGGGGGQHDPLPAQQGRPPQPSAIPAPIPKFPPVQNQALPVAGIDIDPALWKHLPMPGYGDPRSKSSLPSNGPGDAGGMGTANGTGIGEGRGAGFGPGEDGNTGGGRKGPPGGGGTGGSDGNNPDDPDRIYPAPQVTERVRVLSKPEPQYTEDARRNQITGSVILRVVFSRTGAVTNIRTLHALPFGLTERAIAAARLIRFRPATKDGRPVNVYMQLEYNFNLY